MVKTIVAIEARRRQREHGACVSARASIKRESALDDICGSACLRERVHCEVAHECDRLPWPNLYAAWVVFVVLEENRSISAGGRPIGEGAAVSKVQVGTQKRAAAISRWTRGIRVRRRPCILRVRASTAGARIGPLGGSVVRAARRKGDRHCGAQDSGARLHCLTIWPRISPVGFATV